MSKVKGPFGPLWDQPARPGVPFLEGIEPDEELVREIDACPVVQRRIAERIRPYQRKPKPPLPEVPAGHDCPVCAALIPPETEGES